MNFNAFIWEHLPPGATAPEHAPAVDYDADGVDNLSEWLALTDPVDPSSFFRILRIAPILANAVEVTFTSSLGRHYQLSTSANLIDWVAQPTTMTGTGNPVTVPVLLETGSDHHFLRILASP